MSKSNSRLILIVGGTLLLAMFATIYAYSIHSDSDSDSPLGQEQKYAAKERSGQSAEIEVTGRVVEPQVIVVASGSVSMKEAVARAGGPVVEQKNGAPDSDVLALTHAPSKTRWYLPWSVVGNESIGQVSIDGSYQVELIASADLHLEIKETSPSRTSFSVEGNIENPGAFATKSPSTKFMEIMTPEYSGSAKVGDVQADAVVLFRNSPGGSMREVYLIPLGNPYIRPDLLRFRIRAGDHFRFTTLTELHDLPAR